MIKMHKDAKLGDSFHNTKDNKWYYFDYPNGTWVLGLSFIYKNYKGQTSERTVLPLGIFYGVTEYHKDKPQYFLHAWDTQKKAYRDFALKDMVSFL